jgi:integrase
VIRVRRPGRAAPPLLTPGQIERICDACAAWDGEAREWRGCVRDRLLWALLAESGGLVKRGPRGTYTDGRRPGVR